MPAVRSSREPVASPQFDLDPIGGSPPEHFVRTADDLVYRDVLRRDGSWARTEIRTTGPSTGDVRADVDKAFLTSTARPDWSLGKSSVRIADLFSGCGAMSLGIAEASRALGLAFRPVFVGDTNETALGVYGGNFGIDRPAVRDLSQLSSILDGTSTPFELGLQRSLDGVDLVVAGPPCQGHSNLNNHTRRADPKNGLYFKVARFAKLFAPTFVIVENVPAVVRDEGAVVQRTRQALETLGYTVVAGLVDMQKIGVAQTRKRHVLLAVDERRAGFAPRSVHEIAGDHRVPVRDVRWAIGDLEHDVRPGDLYRGVAGMTDVTRERVELLMREGRHELPNEHRPDCHKSGDHSYGSVYGRMHWDRPAPTITSGFVSMGRGRFVHPDRPSTLTPHEAARIQFIPDFFDFSSVVRRNRMAEIIGNAVPPKLSYVLGLELLR